ncbi:MAG: hypothetical protein KGS72_13845 [Cyanobacteria bacterium REEB67]|nr:hypothetical protein [Cyanobacteria bacterium REEB67]
MLVSDGIDAKLFGALKAAATAEGADVDVIAPTIGGVDASDGSQIAAEDRLNGGPSVLFDAVAVLTSADGAARLASNASARDFISDAYANLKYIGFNDAAAALLNRAGVETKEEAGIVPLKDAGDASAFITACRNLRIWDREEKTKMSMK